MHHHTRKKRNHKKSKGLKNNRRSLKSKSKNSRKVNKMNGGLASCTPGFIYWGNKKIPQAWDTANFTKDEIIQAVTTICDKFNSVLIQKMEITNINKSSINAKKIKKYTELNVKTIESKLNSLERTGAEGEGERLNSVGANRTSLDVNSVNDKVPNDFNYVSVHDALITTFVFTDVVEYSGENTRTNSKNKSVDMCQLMKTIYYLITKLKLQPTEDPFLDRDVSTHFDNIAPDLNIKSETLDATHKALGEGFR